MSEFEKFSGNGYHLLDYSNVKKVILQSGIFYAGGEDYKKGPIIQIIFYNTSICETKKMGLSNLDCNSKSVCIASNDATFKNHKDIMNKSVSHVNNGQDISYDMSHEKYCRNISIVFSYFYQTLPSHITKLGFTVIVDGRRSKWEIIKRILDSLELKNELIKNIYIIKPEKFWQKQKTSLGTAKYPFEISMVSFETLYKTCCAPNQLIWPNMPINIPNNNSNSNENIDENFQNQTPTTPQLNSMRNNHQWDDITKLILDLAKLDEQKLGDNRESWFKEWIELRSYLHAFHFTTIGRSGQTKPEDIEMQKEKAANMDENTEQSVEYFNGSCLIEQYDSFQQSLLDNFANISVITVKQLRNHENEWINTVKILIEKLKACEKLFEGIPLHSAIKSAEILVKRLDQYIELNAFVVEATHWKDLINMVLERLYGQESCLKQALTCLGRSLEWYTKLAKLVKETDNVETWMKLTWANFAHKLEVGTCSKSALLTYNRFKTFFTTCLNCPLKLDKIRSDAKQLMHATHSIEMFAKTLNNNKNNNSNCCETNLHDTFSSNDNKERNDFVVLQKLHTFLVNTEKGGPLVDYTVSRVNSGWAFFTAGLHRHLQIVEHSRDFHKKWEEFNNALPALYVQRCFVSSPTTDDNVISSNSINSFNNNILNSGLTQENDSLCSSMISSYTNKDECSIMGKDNSSSANTMITSLNFKSTSKLNDENGHNTTMSESSRLINNTIILDYDSEASEIRESLVKLRNLVDQITGIYMEANLIAQSMLVLMQTANDDSSTSKPYNHLSSPGKVSKTPLEPLDYQRIQAHILSIRDEMEKKQGHAIEHENSQANKRKSELQTLMRHYLFKQDVKHVFEWIVNHGNGYLEKKTSVGRSLSRAKILLKNHNLFEQIAQNTYTNSQKLLVASSKLLINEEMLDDSTISDVWNMSASVHKRENEAILQITEKLKEAVSKLYGAVTERKIALELAVDFYAKIDVIIVWFKDMIAYFQAYSLADCKEEFIEDVLRQHSQRYASLIDTADRLLQIAKKLCTYMGKNGVSLVNDPTGSYTTITKYAHEIERFKLQTNDLWNKHEFKLLTTHKFQIFERDSFEVCNQVDFWDKEILTYASVLPTIHNFFHDILGGIEEYQLHNQNTETARIEINALTKLVQHYQSLIQSLLYRGQDLAKILDDTINSPTFNTYECGVVNDTANLESSNNSNTEMAKLGYIFSPSQDLEFRSHIETLISYTEQRMTAFVLSVERKKMYHERSIYLAETLTEECYQSLDSIRHANSILNTSLVIPVSFKDAEQVEKNNEPYRKAIEKIQERVFSVQQKLDGFIDSLTTLDNLGCGAVGETLINQQNSNLNLINQENNPSNNSMIERPNSYQNNQQNIFNGNNINNNNRASLASSSSDNNNISHNQQNTKDSGILNYRNSSHGSTPSQCLDPSQYAFSSLVHGLRQRASEELSRAITQEWSNFVTRAQTRHRLIMVAARFHNFSHNMKSVTEALVQDYGLVFERESTASMPQSVMTMSISSLISASNSANTPSEWFEWCNHTDLICESDVQMAKTHLNTLLMLNQQNSCNENNFANNMNANGPILLTTSTLERVNKFLAHLNHQLEGVNAASLKHSEQKEQFLKNCSLARRIAEFFLRYLQRSVQERNALSSSSRFGNNNDCASYSVRQDSIDNVSIYSHNNNDDEDCSIHLANVNNVLAQLSEREGQVLTLWTRKKQVMDDCYQYLQLEQSSLQLILWLNEILCEIAKNAPMTASNYLANKKKCHTQNLDTANTTWNVDRKNCESQITDNNKFMTNLKRVTKTIKEKHSNLVRHADTFVYNLIHSHADCGDNGNGGKALINLIKQQHKTTSISVNDSKDLMETLTSTVFSQQTNTVVLNLLPFHLSLMVTHVWPKTIELYHVCLDMLAYRMENCKSNINLYLQTIEKLEISQLEMQQSTKKIQSIEDSIIMRSPVGRSGYSNTNINAEKQEDNIKEISTSTGYSNESGFVSCGNKSVNSQDPNDKVQSVVSNTSIQTTSSSHSQSSADQASNIPPFNTHESSDLLAKSTPTPATLAEIEEKQKIAKKREFIMSELISTEETYVNDLTFCIEHYMNGPFLRFVRDEDYQVENGEYDNCLRKPIGFVETLPKLLRTALDASGLINHTAFTNNYQSSGLSMVAAFVSTVFCNLRAILAFHKDNFLKELYKYKHLPEDVGHCFVTWSHMFYQLYVRYCTNKPHSNTLLACSGVEDSYFHDIQLRSQLPLSLSAYLIKPVQRITKYQLLLKELLATSINHTSEIKDGLEVMLNVPKQANDAMHLSLLSPLSLFGSTYETTQYQNHQMSIFEMHFGELIMQESLKVWDYWGTSNNGATHFPHDMQTFENNPANNSKKKSTTSFMKSRSVVNVGKSGKERQIFVFEMCLLLCKKQTLKDSNIAANITLNNNNNINGKINDQNGNQQNIESLQTELISMIDDSIPNATNYFNLASANNGSRTAYTLKTKILLSEVGITEHIEGDECKFALWHMESNNNMLNNYTNSGAINSTLSLNNGLNDTSIPGIAPPIMLNNAHNSSSTGRRIVFKAPSLECKHTWIKKLRELVNAFSFFRLTRYPSSISSYASCSSASLLSRSSFSQSLKKGMVEETKTKSTVTTSNGIMMMETTKQSPQTVQNLEKGAMNKSDVSEKMGILHGTQNTTPGITPISMAPLAKPQPLTINLERFGSKLYPSVSFDLSATSSPHAVTMNEMQNTTHSNNITNEDTLRLPFRHMKSLQHNVCETSNANKSFNNSNNSNYESPTCHFIKTSTCLPGDPFATNQGQPNAKNDPAKDAMDFELNYLVSNLSISNEQMNTTVKSSTPKSTSSIIPNYKDAAVLFNNNDDKLNETRENAKNNQQLSFENSKHALPPNEECCSDGEEEYINTLPPQVEYLLQSLTANTNLVTTSTIMHERFDVSMGTDPRDPNNNLDSHSLNNDTKNSFGTTNCSNDKNGPLILSVGNTSSFDCSATSQKNNFPNDLNISTKPLNRILPLIPQKTLQDNGLNNELSHALSEFSYPPSQ